MSAEQIVATMLNKPALTNLIGNKIFATSATPNAKPPYLVYEVVSDVAKPNLNVNEPVRSDANIRIYALSLKLDQLQSINDAVKDALHFKFQIVVGGKKVVESRLVSKNPIEKDHETGIYIQGTDCILRYYE